jgi:AcrR family transcriptional regulator
MTVHLMSSGIVNCRSFIYHRGMSPRPRTASDADLLMAAVRAVSRVGPSRLTLADVAAEAGVVPATLLQRFGSKRGLLLALAREGSTASAQELAALRAAHPSPLAALRATADCMAGMANSPEELANHLAFLNIDLTDPDFHRYALEGSRAFGAGLQALLDAAVVARELKRCDTARLARLVQEVLHGGLVAWAIHREGTAREWVRQDLEALLEPYAAAGKRRGPAARARRRRG